MQIVIDIPEEDYRQIKEYYEKNDTVEATYSYIYHGTPLDDMFDKIRAEIEGLTYYWCEVHPRSVIDDVLPIIDKYKAEGSGEE